jgi:hypothetical protein
MGTNTDNYRVEYTNGKVRCYQKTSDGECLVWETTENLIDNPPDVDHNRPVPQKINLIDPSIHYRDLDTVELYKSYAHLLKMIERMDKQAKDPRSSRNMADYHTKWTMNDLREYCQVWLDDVRFRQDGRADRWWVWDRLIYLLKGRMRQRVRWLRTFGTICYDMSSRLDDIDGGNINQQQEPAPQQQPRIGF